MPCDIVGLDVEDSMGYHVVDFFGEITKTRLGEEGEELGDETLEERYEERDFLLKRILQELKLKQGCRF